MARDGWIVGLDIGGTFTDVYMLEPGSGRAARYKSLTTAQDPALGAIVALLGAMGEGGVAADDIAVVLHATTLVSNALIERQAGAESVSQGALVSVLLLDSLRETHRARAK